MIIGYTTGVFDMFHIGHLNILRRAKERCDFLVVGVSTDELVKEYKHKTPVIPFDERFQIISSLRCVDAVVAQTSLDKRSAWEKLHFDVLFHGSDWKGSEMYRKVEMEMKDIGVAVIWIPYTEGVSSTMLRKISKQER